jgi:hypothetical protein
VQPPRTATAVTAAEIVVMCTAFGLNTRPLQS